MGLDQITEDTDGIVGIEVEVEQKVPVITQDEKTPKHVDQRIFCKTRSQELTRKER